MPPGSPAAPPPPPPSPPMPPRPSDSSALIGSKPPCSAPPSLLCWSSSALRIASLTAATTRSWSISTSSGSTASGSITRLSMRMSPVMTILTVPPPVLASTFSDLSASWASCCLASMACASASIFWRLGGCGMSGLLLGVRRKLLRVELVLESLYQIVVGKCRDGHDGRDLGCGAQVIGEPQRGAGDRADGLDQEVAALRVLGLALVERRHLRP